MLPLQEDNSVVIEDRISTETQTVLEKMGVKVRVSPAWDYHMGSFQICYIDQKTGKLCTTADPRRCGIGDGIPKN
jgi:gamma-glutamyltranspeptidase/glutathione hydrolase